MPGKALRRGKNRTYYDRVMEVLCYEPMSIPEILEQIELPESEYAIERSSKSTYVIDGLKKGINNGTIEQIITKGEKRKFLGHLYKLVK